MKYAFEALIWNEYDSKLYVNMVNGAPVIVNPITNLSI